MKLFTTKQKELILRKKIKVGEFYSFPPLGFTFYADFDYPINYFF